MKWQWNAIWNQWIFGVHVSSDEITAMTHKRWWWVIYVGPFALHVWRDA